MFGALNRFIARLDSEPIPQGTTQQQQPDDSSLGFQVLRNTNPNLPLEPYFDFIVGINGHSIDSPDHNLLVAEIHNCAGGLCSLDLWSAKGQRTHTLTIPVPPLGQPLGLSLQLTPLNSTQHIWHVLTIPSPLSPAREAGLLEHSDYILGSPGGTLRGEAAFGELVEDHLNRSLVLWVYNSEFDVVREVELIPRRGWGGEGALGAVLGYGALHRLPIGLGEEVQAPGENLFDADRKSMDNFARGESAQFLQQQQQQSPPPPPEPAQNIPPPPMMNPAAPPPQMLGSNAPPPGRGVASKKKGRHGALSPNSGFDDMFAEGQKKSAEQDYVSGKKGQAKPPPPPSKSNAAPPTAQASLTTPTADEDLGEPGEAEVT